MVERETWRTALILGGARSGKTRHALALAESCPLRTYVATAEAWDDEMAERIRLHKAERDATWTTHEAPLDVAATIEDSSRRGPNRSHAMVVDCLTIWISNLMHHERDIEAETRRLTDAVAAFQAAEHEHRLIFVSNEVGLGIVPDNAMARAFRDHQGCVNQAVAGIADQVVFVAAGLPLVLK